MCVHILIGEIYVLVYIVESPEEWSIFVSYIDIPKNI